LHFVLNSVLSGVAFRQMKQKRRYLMQLNRILINVKEEGIPVERPVSAKELNEFLYYDKINEILG
jgi:hypothetical protein